MLCACRCCGHTFCFFSSADGLNGASHIKPAIYNLPFPEASFVFTQGSWQECWPPQSKALPALANQYSGKSAAHYEAIDYLGKFTPPCVSFFSLFPLPTLPPPIPGSQEGRVLGWKWGSLSGSEQFVIRCQNSLWKEGDFLTARFLFTPGLYF